MFDNEVVAFLKLVEYAHKPDDPRTDEVSATAASVDSGGQRIPFHLSSCADLAPVRFQRQERHKVGVTLNSGQKVMYDADVYVILPNSRHPQMVEFRKVDIAKNTYRRVAHAKWSDISELHAPLGLTRDA